MAKPNPRSSSSLRVAGLGRVVVATDFSRAALRATERVARLPLAAGAQVLIVHVLPPRLTATSGLRIETATERLRELRSAMLAELGEDGRSDVAVRVRAVRGKAAEQIASLAALHEPDMVVLGRRGAGRFRDLLLGSTVRRVVRTASFPVLVVGSKADVPYRSIVAGVDLSLPAVRALRLAARLAVPDTTEFTVVSAVDDPGPVRVTSPSWTPFGRRQTVQREIAARVTSIRKIMARVEPEPSSWHLVVKPADARELILRIAEQEGADLVAVGTTSTPRFTRLFVGSVAEAVLDHSKGDILIHR